MVVRKCVFSSANFHPQDVFHFTLALHNHNLVRVIFTPDYGAGKRKSNGSNSARVMRCATHDALDVGLQCVHVSHCKWHVQLLQSAERGPATLSIPKLAQSVEAYAGLKNGTSIGW
jgi:hypothetical protein